MRREDRETIPDGYRTVFDKLSIRWGLIFVDDQIVILIDPRRRLLDILHFGHSGCLRGLNRKHGRWYEILRDILNGKLKIVQNPKQPKSDIEEDEDDDEETPEETGTPTKVGTPNVTEVTYQSELARIMMHCKSTPTKK